MARLLHASTLLLVSSLAHAEGTIEVTAVGSSSSAITAIELRFEVTGTDELAKDAAQRFDGAKNRAIKAFLELDIEGLNVRGEGFRVRSETPGQDPMGQVIMIGGPGNQTRQKKRIRIDEQLVTTVPITGLTEATAILDRLTDVIDTAHDADIEPIGSTDHQMAYFMGVRPQVASEKATAQFLTLKVKDMTKLEQAAQANALAAARSKADHLATLSSLQLNGAKSIQVQATMGLEQDGAQPAQAKLYVTMKVVYRTK